MRGARFTATSQVATVGPRRPRSGGADHQRRIEFFPGRDHRCAAGAFRHPPRRRCGCPTSRTHAWLAARIAAGRGDDGEGARCPRGHQGHIRADGRSTALFYRVVRSALTCGQVRVSRLHLRPGSASRTVVRGTDRTCGFRQVTRGVARNHADPLRWRRQRLVDHPSPGTRLLA